MSNPIVSIAQGKLQGKTSKNIDNGPFYSFQGIPYAKPPINELRFKAPQPAEPWDGIRDATKEGSECYSRHMVFKNIVGSEDCLFLNVYTPQIPSEDHSASFPVMFWVHGGGFRHGSSKTDIYGPEYLLTEDVVLVTVNYRIGIFGFLNFEDPSLDVPGNAGMKDMVLALKWVQENIRSFCGDPNNVTVFGESAGGSAVHYLVLSPLTKGLFHKAIAQSGCAINTLARGRNMLLELASILDLVNANEKDVLEELMSLPVDKLLEIGEKAVKMCDIYNNYGKKRPFAPVIERPSPEAFIAEEPIDIINSGNYNKVPLIFGYNTREGMLVETMMKPKMPDDFETLIPFTLGLEVGSETSRSVADKIKQFYYGQPESENNLENFYLLHTDNYFVREIICATKRHAVTNTCPVYLYRMSIETSMNVFKKFSNISAPGVAHGDDLGYLFKTVVSPDLKPDTKEYKAVKIFVKMWTNFAKYGNPNLKDENTLTEWKPVNEKELNFIDIGEELVPGVDPESERMEFWREILKINPSYMI